MLVLCNFLINIRILLFKNYNRYLFYRKRELNNYLPPKRIIDKAFISRCDTCENCISGNTQLKCVNRHMPWKGLYLSKKIDSSVDKVNLFFSIIKLSVLYIFLKYYVLMF